MATKALKTSADKREVIQAGESALITATLYDSTGAALNKAAIQTLTLSLINEADNTVINSRNDQNIKDVNGGSIVADGTVTIKLGPTDNVIVDTPVDQIENHIARVKWTWVDAESATQTGIQEWIIEVQPLREP